MPVESDHSSSPATPERHATLVEVAGAVFCSFLGIRKGSAMQGARIKPAHVIVMGVVSAAMLVLALLLLVRFIIGHAAG